MNSKFYLHSISFFQLGKLKKSFFSILLLLFSTWNLVLAQASGNNLNFEGTNAYVNLDKKMSFPNTTSFEIEAWVCRKTGNEGIFFSINNSGVIGHYFPKLNTSRAIYYSKEAVPWRLTTTATTIFTGNWTAPSLSTVTNYIFSV